MEVLARLEDLGKPSTDWSSFFSDPMRLQSFLRTEVSNRLVPYLIAPLCDHQYLINDDVDCIERPVKIVFFHEVKQQVIKAFFNFPMHDHIIAPVSLSLRYNNSFDRKRYPGLPVDSGQEYAASDAVL